MLKLDKLKLTNFMNISSAIIDFSKQTTLLSGSNGQGKSSVVEALALCFLERKRSDAFKDYVKYGETEAKLHLTAKIDNDNITFDVTITAAGTTDKNVNYKNVKYHNSEVSGLLESLGFNYYGDLLFSMQGGSDITALSPTQRLNYLKSLLNFDYSFALDKIENSLDAAKEDQQKISNEIEFLEKSIETRKLEIKEPKELPFSKKEIDGFLADIESYTKQLEEYNTVVKQNQEHNNKIIENQSAVSKINSDITRLEYESQSLKEKVENQKEYKESLDKNTAELQNVEASIASLESQIASLNNEINSYTDEVNSLNKENMTIKTAIENLQSRISSINDNSSAIRGDSTELIELFHKLAEENEKAKSLQIDIASKKKSIELANNGKCPVCGNEFTDEHKADLENELTQLNDDYNNAHYRMTSIKDDCVKLLKVKQYELEISLADIISKTNDVNSKLSESQNSLASLQDEKMKLNSSKMSLTSAINELNKSIIDTTDVENTLSKNSSLISNLQNNAENLNKEIETLKSSIVDAVEPDKTAYNNADASLKLQKEAESANEIILTSNKNAEDFIAQSDKTIEDNKNKLINIDSNIDVYKNAKQIFEKNLPNFLVVKTCSKIQSTMNAFIQSIFPNMEVKLFHSKKGVEFYYTTLSSVLKEEEKTKENMLNIKMASGFEKAILTIAFKEALCKAYNLPFCVLDEVDAAASEENSERLFNSIICGGFFKQAIIITHKPVVRDIIKQLSDTNSYEVENGVFKLE